MLYGDGPMKMRVVIEYDLHWNPGDKHLQTLFEIANWESGHITIHNVREIKGSSIDYQLIDV